MKFVCEAFAQKATPSLMLRYCDATDAVLHYNTLKMYI